MRTLDTCNRLGATSAVPLCRYSDRIQCRPGSDDSFRRCVCEGVVFFAVDSRVQDVRNGSRFAQQILAQPFSGPVVAGLGICNGPKADLPPIVSSADGCQCFQVPLFFRDRRPARSSGISDRELTVSVSSVGNHLVTDIERIKRISASLVRNYSEGAEQTDVYFFRCRFFLRGVSDGDAGGQEMEEVATYRDSFSCCYAMLR